MDTKEQLSERLDVAILAARCGKQSARCGQVVAEAYREGQIPTLADALYVIAFLLGK